MNYLIAVTIVWAFSFSLIGVYLSGQVDSYFAVMMRIALAVLVFLPFLKLRLLSKKHTLTLIGIGAVQLGVMYIFFYQSFLLLSVPEVLLFTIFTPVYVALLDDLLFGRFTPIYLVTALLAVLGAAIIRYDGVNNHFWLGFLVVQGANLCFALGQVAYRKLAKELPTSLPWHNVFAWFFVGALLIAVPAWLLLGNTAKLPSTATQWGVLLWLGLVASGLGYFAWNKGATQVDAGTLAIMNNALIPAGLIVNLTLWNRDENISRLLLGGMIIVASLMLNYWWLQRRNLQEDTL
ncbi:MAG: EamA family transporter [Proteobacteria bacterium]|nr:MAG: EamA family transporter [Pseudomonadota bacterium]